jgi:hypothetical protein
VDATTWQEVGFDGRIALKLVLKEEAGNVLTGYICICIRM